MFLLVLLPWLSWNETIERKGRGVGKHKLVWMYIDVHMHGVWACYVKGLKKQSQFWIGRGDCFNPFNFCVESDQIKKAMLGFWGEQ